MRLVVLGRLAFLLATMQSSSHLAEQRADPLARSEFDWPDRLNLREDFQNLGVHVMHQLFVGRGSNRTANRLRIRRTVRDDRNAADTKQRCTAVFRRIEPLTHSSEVLHN